jgi:hypothetical protein
VGTADGSSWSDAFTDLQDALDAAAVGGGEIRVAQGTYVPSRRFVPPDDDPDNPRAVTFFVPDGVTLRGGYAGLGGDDPDSIDIEQFQTILSGDLLGDDSPDFQNRADNAYHVLLALDAAIVLDGLVIVGGNADSQPTKYDGTTDKGGGLYQQGGSLALHNCTFRDNYAGRATQSVVVDTQHWPCDCYGLGGGGAVYANAEPLTIRDSRFIGNRSTCGAGGHLSAHSLTIEGTGFDGNVAGCGGGVVASGEDIQIEGTTFRANSAVRELDSTPSGGAVSAIARYIEFHACTFLQNSAAYDGASVVGYAGDMGFRDCTVAESQGTALTAVECDRLTLRRCTFRDNYGLGIFIEFGGSTVLEDSSFERNGPGGVLRFLGRARDLQIERCAFDANSAHGAVVNAAGGPTLVRDSVFSENVSGYGGALSGTRLTVADSTFQEPRRRGFRGLRNPSTRQV